MFVVLDIETLQLTSLSDVIKYYLPTAKVVCITYNIQWMLLPDMVSKDTPEGVKVYWVCANQTNMVSVFEGFIARACMAGAEDHILFMDPSTTDGRTLLLKYGTCTKPIVRNF